MRNLALPELYFELLVLALTRQVSGGSSCLSKKGFSKVRVTQTIQSTFLICRPCHKKALWLNEMLFCKWKASRGDVYTIKRQRKMFSSFLLLSYNKKKHGNTKSYYFTILMFFPVIQLNNSQNIWTCDQNSWTHSLLLCLNVFEHNIGPYLWLSKCNYISGRLRRNVEINFLRALNWVM